MYIGNKIIELIEIKILLYKHFVCATYILNYNKIEKLFVYFK